MNIQVLNQWQRIEDGCLDCFLNMCNPAVRLSSNINAYWIAEEVGKHQMNR